MVTPLHHPFSRRVKLIKMALDTQQIHEKISGLSRFHQVLMWFKTALIGKFMTQHFYCCWKVKERNRGPGLKHSLSFVALDVDFFQIFMTLTVPSFHLENTGRISSSGLPQNGNTHLKKEIIMVCLVGRVPAGGGFRAKATAKAERTGTVPSGSPRPAHPQKGNSKVTLDHLKGAQHINTPSFIPGVSSLPRNHK